MGVTTNLFPSMTLGSGSAGKGMTSDNVSPMNLIYIRKVGYGVRRMNEIITSITNVEEPQGSNDRLNNNENDNEELLKMLLKKILKELK